LNTALGTGEGRDRAIPKDVLDFPLFLWAFADADDPWRLIRSADAGPFVRRLHLRLLLDTLYFSIAHETAHILLDHTKVETEDNHAVRQFEADADRHALDLLDRIPGFRPRSLPIVFNFLADRETDREPAEMSHPTSRNRLVILGESLLERPDG
jgi:hypothetical protein